MTLFDIGVFYLFILVILLTIAVVMLLKIYIKEIKEDIESMEYQPSLLNELNEKFAKAVNEEYDIVTLETPESIYTVSLALKITSILVEHCKGVVLEKDKQVEESKEPEDEPEEGEKG